MSNIAKQLVVKVKQNKKGTLFYLSLFVSFLQPNGTESTWPFKLVTFVYCPDSYLTSLAFGLMLLGFVWFEGNQRKRREK